MEQIIINIIAKDNTSVGVKSAESQLNRFERSMNKTQSKINKMNAKMNISATDKASAIIDKVKTKANRLTSKIWNISLGIIDKVTSPLKGVLNMFKNPLFTAGAVIGVSLSLGSAINTYADFEATMSKVMALSGTTGSAMDAITDKAKQIGLSTKFTAKEAGDAFTYMGMAGWKSGQMLAGVDGIINLSRASGEDLATVSDIVTDDLTAFKMQAGEAGHFADVLAKAATSANTNVSMMGETFKYVGPLAGTMGYSIEDMSIAVGLMANSSIKGSQAGTSLKTAIANMASPTDKMAEAMKGLGISLTDSEGNAKSFRSVMDNIRTSFKCLIPTERAAFASTIFGKEAMSGMLAIINASEADYKSLTTAIDNADGAAKRMAETMEDNLKGSLTKLQSATQGTLMSLGERLAPYAREATDWVTDNMQYVEKYINKIMDNVDIYIEQAKAKIAAFTGTKEWAQADIFGKAKISWNKLIGDPLGEWWSGKGKSIISGIAKSIGSGLGSAFSVGLMGLLGVDITSAANEGASIGASFAQGFTSKFNIGEIISKAIKSHPILSALIGLKLGTSLFSAGKSIISGIGNVGKGLKGIFTGSSSSMRGALSAVSAMTVTAGVVNLNSSITNAATLSGQRGAYQARRARTSARNAETLAGNTTEQPYLGKYVIRDKAGNTIGGTNSILQAGLAKTGVFLGSKATTVGGQALAGSAGITGGIVAAGTLLSAGGDLYHGYNSEDNGERGAYYKSAGAKAGGVAAGATAGATIGSVVPVLGTAIGALIGAGLGGLVGSTIGEGIKKNFEKAKVESESLKAAIDDDEASTEDLQRALENACNQNLQKHFGKIKLSLAEISRVAKDITLGSKVKEFEKFSETATSLEKSYESLATSQKAVEKSTWKFSVGMQFEEEDYTNLKQEIDSFISDGKTYLTDNQLEFQAGVNLILGEDSTNYDGYKGVNWMYQKIQKEFSDNKLEFEQEYEVTIKDGKIDDTEMKNLQQYIDKQNILTNKFTAANTEAKSEVLKSKFLGGNLSYDSFNELREELKTNYESGKETYESALESSIANLIMSRNSGEISEDTYNHMVAALYEGTNEQIQGLRDNVMNFELDSIIEAYSKELDEILPDLTGTTQQKLSKFLENTDIQGLNTSQIMEKLGLSNLSTEVQENIAKMLKEMQVDIEVGDLLKVNNNGVKNAGLFDFLQNTDIASISSDDLVSRLGLDSASLGVTSEQIKAAVRSLKIEISTGDILKITESGVTGSQLFNFLENTDIASFTPKQIVQKHGINEETVGIAAEEIKTKLRQLKIDMTDVGLFEGDTNLSSRISQLILSNIDVPFVGDFSNFGNSVGTAVGTSINNGIVNANTGINTAKGTLENNIKNILGTPMTVDKDITINYKVLNPNPPAAGGSRGDTTDTNKPHKASGGFVSRATELIAGEAGTEVIIPLSSSRRNRGLDLWEKAGQMLGVKTYADGGFVGGIYKENYLSNDMYDISDNDMAVPIIVESGQSPRINITVGASPSITISNESNADVLQVLRENLSNVTDEILEQVAEVLEGIFKNRARG